MTGARPSDVTSAVLAWGGPRLRDLPWRGTRDPWAVLVSEVMLAQTQVARVIPAWQAFLDRYPNPEVCAAAPLGDVLRVWQGLGYPRRARNLHSAALAIAERGGVPADLAGLLALPGVGPYTARAVLVFAFEQPEAVVDTNIARVLARLAGRRLRSAEAQAAADALVPVDAAWTWNQAVMDLGATVCRPQPRCAECPAALWCAWHRAGLPDPDPAIGSAHVSTRQAPYAGSDRQARGTLLRRLGDGAILRSAVPSLVGRDAADAERLVAGLVAEGLVVDDQHTLRLP